MAIPKNQIKSRNNIEQAEHSDEANARRVKLVTKDGELTYTTNDNEAKYAADVVALNRLIDVPHDDIEITSFTTDGNAQTIEFRENGNLKLTLNLTYTIDGELQRVQRIRA